MQDIIGPMCFDYGFGPFRWVCTSADAKDLAKTDSLALEVMQRMKKMRQKKLRYNLMIISSGLRTR